MRLFREPRLSYKRCAVALCVIVLAIASGGCAQLDIGKDGKGRDYATLSADLNRDTELAEQKHAEAVRLIEGDGYGQHGDLEQAEVLLRDALVADVSFGPAHNSLGVVYMLTGRLYLAAWEFEMAARTMTTLGEPHNNLGLVYEQARRFDDAIGAFEMALSLEPHHPEYVGNLARARLRRGDTVQEVQQLLSEVAFADARPEWSQWAQAKLALAGLKVASTASPAVWQEDWPEDRYEELPGEPRHPDAPIPPGEQDPWSLPPHPGELPMPDVEVPSLDASERLDRAAVPVIAPFHDQN